MVSGSLVQTRQEHAGLPGTPHGGAEDMLERGTAIVPTIFADPAEDRNKRKSSRRVPRCAAGSRSDRSSARETLRPGGCSPWDLVISTLGQASLIAAPALH